MSTREATPQKDNQEDEKSLPRSKSGSVRSMKKVEAGRERSDSTKAERSGSISDLKRSTSKADVAPPPPGPKDIVEKDAIWAADPVTGEYNILKASTLERAVEKLTQESGAADQQQFLSMFILTYRSFTTAEKLFELIQKRFEMPVPAGLVGEQLEAFKRKQQTARLRTCIVLRYWLANGYADFDEKTLKVAVEFIEQKIMPVLASSAQSLLQIIEKKRQGTREAPPTRPEPMPKALMTAEQWDIKQISSMPVVEVARQLTLIEHAIFVDIPLGQFIKQAWLKANKDVIAPNIVAAIKRFNLVSNWITSEVLSVNTLKERASLIEYFVKLAVEFSNLQNYCGVLEVLSALQQTPLQRLKDTWAEVGQKWRKTFQDLAEAFQPMNNWKSARDILRRNQPPSIPYIGIYLTDLVFIDEGMPDLERDLTNFDKYRKMAAVLQEIQMYQNAPYWLEQLAFCRAQLENLPTISENEMYDRSYAIAPRHRKPAASAADAAAAPDASATGKPAAPAIGSSSPLLGSKLSNASLSDSQTLMLQEVALKIGLLQANLTSAVASTLEQRFPRCPVVPWVGVDRARYVYGWAEDIKIDTVEQSGVTYCIYPRLQATKAELAALQRIVHFYKTQTGLTEVKGVLLAAAATPEESTMAASLGNVELLVADPAGPPPLGSSSSSIDTSSDQHSPTPSPHASSFLGATADSASSSPLNGSWAQPIAAAAPGSGSPAASSSPVAAAPASTPPQAQTALQTGAYANWKAFLLAAELSEDVASKYEQILLANAVEIDQVGDLTADLCRNLGFRMGHILKITRLVQTVTGRPPG